MKLYNENKIKELEEATLREWEKFRNALGKEEFKYNDIKEAKKNTFFKVFVDALTYEKRDKLIVTYMNELDKDYLFCRGTIMNKNEVIGGNDFKRFMPDQKKFPRINRFSPKGKEFLYLACEHKKQGDFKDIEEVALKEIRAKKGDNIGICKFKIRNDRKMLLNKKIIDLSIYDNKTFDNIAEKYDKWLKNLTNKDEEIEKEALRCLFEMYFKIISNQIFKPVKGTSKELEYSPFHCLAYYLQSIGFDGIIYTSTVSNNKYGKNIVLFDKSYAQPYKIKTFKL